MDRAADIIPISSRSARRPPVLAAEPLGSTPEPRRRGWWALLLVLAGLVLVAIVALARAEKVEAIRALPAADRTALYHRTMTDLDTTCAVPAARDGALRDHCLRQAEFLTLFPDCDARCQQLATSILPHARR